MNVVKEVFKRYDIRGIYLKEIDTKFAYFLGKSLGEYIIKHKYPKKVIIGGDLRDSTPFLKNSFIKGLFSKGIEVYDTGIASSDLTAFLSKEYQAIGVQITASHNPLHMNGFKFMYSSLPFTNEMLKEIKEVFMKIASEKYLKVYNEHTTGEYKVIYSKAYEKYIKRIIEILNIRINNSFKELKVGFLTQNSSVLPLLKKLKELNKIPEEVDIYSPQGYSINKTFPTEPNERDFLSMVEEYDIAFMFDPDGDRVMIYDKEVGILNGHGMLSSLCLSFSEKCKRMVTSIDFSEEYTKYLHKKGIEVLKTKVGDVFVSNFAYKNHSIFFGEPNNHIGWGNISYYHSGFITALYYLSKREKILQEYKQLPNIDIEILKTQKYNSPQEFLKKLSFEDITILSDIDGIKFKKNDSYILVRKSGTEGVLRITLENANKHIKEEIKAIL